MGWWILLSLLTVLLILLVWMLVAPIILYVNTEEKRYYFEMKGIFKIIPTITSELDFIVRIQTPLYSFVIKPLEMKRRRKKLRKKKETKKVSGKRSKPGKSLRSKITLAQNILKTFRVKKFWLDIDFDDYVLNAQLVPVFLLISSNQVRVTTNFLGRLSLILIIQNRIWNMALIFIRYRLSK